MPTLRPAEVALLASVFVVAACGLVYELAAGALASYLLGDSVLQFSTVIGAYLFAMGIGSWLSRFFERQLVAHFLRIELLVGLVGGLMPAALFALQSLAPGSFRVALYGLVVAVGIGVGLEIPLVMRILKRHFADRYALKDLVSQVLTFDYLGALAVSIAFPLLLVPQLGLIRTGLLFGLFNAAVAVWALWLFRAELRHVAAHGMACALAVAVLLIAFAGAGRVTTWAEDRFYGDAVLFSEQSPYQRVVVTAGRAGVRLFLNGNLQFHSRDEYRYHEALVHPVMAAHGAPKRVLVLGGGDGMAVREILKYPGVEHVTLVELDPHMTALFARQPLLRALNGGSLSSPKLTIVNADAFGWLDGTTESFDVIVVDFPDPTNFSIGKLYTTSFYQRLDARLDAGGYAVVQTTSPLIARKSFWTVAATLEAVGLTVTPYHAHVPSFGEWGFLIASRRPYRVPAALPPGLRFLDLAGLPALFEFPPDMARVPAEPNRLSNQVLVQTYDEEWGSRSSMSLPRRLTGEDRRAQHEGAPASVSRRAVLASVAALPFAGCAPHDEAMRFDGGWVGAAHERGHRLRAMATGAKSGALPVPAVQRRAGVIVVGGGIAGLGCAAALARAGVDDVHLLELEDVPGGNSRGHRMAGLACPLGAHYLPLPGPRAVEVIALLERLGLRRTEHGRAVYDERHLCHSPQERLCIDGHWHEGLLPPVAALPVDERAPTLAQYRRFAERVAALAGRSGEAFALPSARSHGNAGTAALDAVTFAAWLDGEGLTAPALRWYLDYCCRDDYGAGATQVSAWAGIHYFASRHGFHAPGDDDAASPERDGVLTWPEGNVWLARRIAAPLGQRVHAGITVLRVDEGRHAVTVDAWNEAAMRAERWTAPQVVLATPLFVSARLLTAPPSALAEAAATLRWAPWLVANLQLDAPLADRPGAPPSWDNVVYDVARRGWCGNVFADASTVPSSAAPQPARPLAMPGALGYVDATHQALLPFAGPTVLTAYVALGGNGAAQLRANRAALLAADWKTQAEAVVRDLARVHADLPGKVGRVDLMRYGHAMAVPAPGVRGSAALRALAASSTGRVRFAHADLSGYSVFEEALFRGEAAAAAVLGAHNASPARAA